MRSMLAAVQSQIGKFEVREIEKPIAGPGEVVVRVRAALTCGTDRKILERGHVRFPPPLVMGHEFSGEVVESGEGSGFSPGEPVMAGLSGPCGECAACLAGASNRCEGLGREMAWGAFAQYILIPRKVVAQNLHRRPESLSEPAAAILDPLACVARGASALQLSGVRQLLVLGSGPMGLLWVAVARLAGVEKILCAGRGEERLELARRWGAQSFHADSPGIPSSETVVECVGTPEAWKRAFDLVSPGGRVLYFGGCAPGATVSLDAAKLHYQEVSVAGSFHYRPADVRTALGWLEAGSVDPRPLFSDEGSLSELPAFFERMREGKGIKYIVRP
jgi:L-iditol 2-dehydrogenase